MLFLAHVQSLECYLLITVPRRAENDDGTKNQPVMQLWSYSLTLMQEVGCVVALVLYYHFIYILA